MLTLPTEGKKKEERCVYQMRGEGEKGNWRREGEKRWEGRDGFPWYVILFAYRTFKGHDNNPWEREVCWCHD